MGSQWRGCGEALLSLAPFYDIIQRCRSALLPFGCDVEDIITREEPDPMKSTTNSFVAIAAIQVGLVEVLRSVGLSQFDGFVGHSVGELGCGYADGCLTPEQTVLAAYWRGRSVEEAGLQQGKMAAVGLSAEEAEEYIVPGSDVVVACKNSATSITLSGPTAQVESIQERLDADGVFCRSVDSGGIAFHHTSLRKAAPRLLTELQKIILHAVRRSKRWISSSVPESRWDSGIAQKASPEYWVNNLVSPVLFADALKKIPPGSRIIEVAPHALMQAVLRRGLKECTLFPLIRKEADDPFAHLLHALGKLYVSGEKMNLQRLYGQTSRPVPTNTPSISSLIRWDHSIEWDVMQFSGSSGSQYKLEVDINDPTLEFLEGHAIDGRVLFPATGYMTLAWKALAKLLERKWDELPVTFEDVVLHQATVLSNPVNFTVKIIPARGNFEVLAGGTVAATGIIQVGIREGPERASLKEILNKKQEEHSLELTHDEVYKELRLRGYQYSGVFKGVRKSDLVGSIGELSWQENWISLLDNLLQFSLIGSPMKGLYLPTRIRKVYLDPNAFIEALPEDEEKFVQVRHIRNLGITSCPGVEIYGLKATMAPRKQPSDAPVLESYQFFPNDLMNNNKMSVNLSFEEATKLLLDIVLENTDKLKIKIGHINSRSYEDVKNFGQILLKGFDFHPLLASEYTLVMPTTISKTQENELFELGIEVASDLAAVEDKLNLMIVSGDEIESVPENAFVLADSELQIKKLGLMLVAAVRKQNLFLYRKPHIVSEISMFEINCADTAFSWVDSLRDRLGTFKGEMPLWLMAKGMLDVPEGLLGMVKCLKREPNGHMLRCLIDPMNRVEGNSTLWKNIKEADLAYNIVSKDSVGTMRHLLLAAPEKKLTGHAYLNVLTRGDLSSLTWLQGAEESKNEDLAKTVSCAVSVAPLNFRDIMLASGKLPPDALPGSVAQKECILGLEFAGFCEDGRRVMGLLSAGGLSTSVRADPDLLWEVPSEWSLKEASTVPVVYATAYYALVIRGGLQSGESVLIHAGSGGVGQAALSIALARGCRVFTTVSSEKKRNFLKEKFPQLTDNNFANSRDATFEFNVLERTAGEGVDLVLNSLAGDLLQASVRCLKEHGRFLEIGKADLASNTALGMAIFLKNITFHGILLDALFEGSSERKQALQKVVYDGIASGEVKPLPSTTYTHDQAEEAFRFMASGKHIGKVLLEISPEENNKHKQKSKRKCAKNNVVAEMVYPQIPALYRFWPRPELVYVITGGLGGLGLEIADWLIGRGASKIVLTSRRGIATGYQTLCVNRWLSSGANVRVLQQDASSTEGAEKLLNEAATQGPVGGIFHLAMVLEDSVFENQSSDKFSRVSRVKARGAISLDVASRRLCPELHLWVTFSSVACGKGNAGQANYGWANSVSERVVERRVRDGLPALAIQWGGIADVGVLADTLGNVEVAGTRPQSLRSVLASLDELLGSGVPVVGSVCLASKKSAGREKGTKSLVASLANILGIRDIAKAPLDVSLGNLGMDSLMAVEIKQTLEREADVVLSTEQIRDLTIRKVQEMDGSKDNNDTKEEEQTTSENRIQNDCFSWLDFPLIASEVVRLLYAPSNDLGYTSPPMFVCSPIQGTADVLADVAGRFKTRVIGLQYPPDLPSADVVKLAEVLIEHVENLVPGGDFHLCGYSFGASVAYEMATQLELKGRRPLSLIMLDGSHAYVFGVIGNYVSKYSLYAQKGSEFALSNFNEQEFEEVNAMGTTEAMITYTLQFYKDVNTAQMRSELMQLGSLEERVKHTAQVVTEYVKQSGSTVELSVEEVERSASLFFNRLFGHLESRVISSLSLPTLLVRASHNPQLQSLGKDYGLSKVIQGPLKVEEVLGTHESFIFGESGKKVAEIINTFINNI